MRRNRRKIPTKIQPPRCVAVAATMLVALFVATFGAGPWPARAQAASPTAAQGAERYVIDASASQALYHVTETFIDRNNRLNVAVGTTHGIQGAVLIDRAHPRQSRVGPITVDISQLTSNSRRRDNAIRQQWLESSKYPTAVFTPKSIQGLPDTYVDGREVPIQIAGDLQVRDMTKPVTFAGTVKLEGDTLTGHATTTVLMTDFGFDPPSILGLLKAENQAQLELQLTARRTP